MASDGWTLKLVFEGETRRLRGWVACGEEPTFDKFRLGAMQLFNLAASDVEALTLRYVDDEDDVCTLTEVTFSDLLCLSIESRLVKAKLETSPAATTTPLGRAEPVLDQVFSSCTWAQQTVSEHAGDNLRRLRSNVEGGAARAHTGLRDGGEQLRRSFTDRVRDGGGWARQNVDRLDSGVREATQQVHHSFTERFGGAHCNGEGQQTETVPPLATVAAVAVGGLALLARSPLVGVVALAAGATLASRGNSGVDAQAGTEGAIAAEPPADVAQPQLFAEDQDEQPSVGDQDEGVEMDAGFVLAMAATTELEVDVGRTTQGTVERGVRADVDKL